MSNTAIADLALLSDPTPPSWSTTRGVVAWLSFPCFDSPSVPKRSDGLAAH